MNFAAASLTEAHAFAADAFGIVRAEMVEERVGLQHGETLLEVTTRGKSQFS